MILKVIKNILEKIRLNKLVVKVIQVSLFSIDNIVLQTKQKNNLCRKQKSYN